MRSDINSSDERITRISIDPDDSAYRDDYRNFSVLLDGKRVPFVITADEASGEVWCDLLDERGQPVSKDGEWVRRKRTGRVEIRRIEGRGDTVKAI
jgi:hypothetical protein